MSQVVTHNNFKWWLCDSSILIDVNNIVSNLRWVIVHIGNIYNQRSITSPLGEAELITGAHFEGVLVWFILVIQTGMDSRGSTTCHRHQTSLTVNVKSTKQNIISRRNKVRI